MKRKDEVRVIKKLFANQEYQSVRDLLQYRNDLKKILLPEFCISGIYTDDTDPVETDKMVGVNAAFFYESGFHPKVGKHILQSIIYELRIEDSQFREGFVRFLSDSEQRGISEWERKRRIGTGWASLLLYLVLTEKHAAEKEKAYINDLQISAINYLISRMKYKKGRNPNDAGEKDFREKLPRRKTGRKGGKEKARSKYRCRIREKELKNLVKLETMDYENQIRFIEKTYNQQCDLPNSIRNIYEKAVLDTYEETRDLLCIVDGFRYLPNSYFFYSILLKYREFWSLFFALFFFRFVFFGAVAGQ